MIGGRRAAAVSRGLAALAAIALAVGAVLAYADHAVFRSEAFADRTAATFKAAPVRDATARRLADAIFGIRPDLVALRPIVELATRGVVGTSQFRSLVRRAALDSHRAAFDDERRAVSFQIRDAGVLVAVAIGRLRPDAASRVPTRVVTRVARIKGGVDGFMLRLAELADGARRVRWIAFAAALVLAVAAVVVTDSRRASVLRLGVALAIVSLVVALASALAPGLVAGGVGRLDRDAVHAAIGVWLDPVTAWSLAGCVVGLVVALAAAAIVRPIPVMALVRRAWAAAASPPRNRLDRALRACLAIALGAAMVASPRGVLAVAVVVLGILVVLAAFAELLALAAGPTPATPQRPSSTPGRGRAPSSTRTLRVGAVVVLIVAGVGLAAALAGGEETAVARIGRCNGHASLCDRRVDQVAFLGTHNAMAAADEPGWLFAAQNAGISQQLEDGVRAFTIDTHYGIRTPRGVATDLSGETKSRAKLVDQLGGTLVATAERLRARIGRNPKGERQLFLCHAFCEVGATRAVDALTALHRFLVTHPEEVVVLSIEDDTSAADTAAAIRASGLVDEVYRGAARAPWPTLRELVERDERAIVLTENHPAPESWIHHQPAVMQETPFHFETPAELAAPAGCEPNRGGTAGSLFLVNHWVDTSPAPRVTLARRVNAHEFLARRIAMCRARRHLLPNVIAVDFYREGDAARVVDELNGLR